MYNYHRTLALRKANTHFLLKSSPSLLYFSAISGYCRACCSTYSMVASRAAS